MSNPLKCPECGHDSFTIIGYNSYRCEKCREIITIKVITPKEVTLKDFTDYMYDYDGQGFDDITDTFTYDTHPLFNDDDGGFDPGIGQN